VCDRRLRDLRRSLDAIAETCGVAFEGIELTGGGHYRATFRCGNVVVPIYMSATPSDWRAQHKIKAFARRKLRSMVPA
jgi:hypothetical protein